MDGDLPPRRAGFTPEKITREHQQRLAIVYIRQSTAQQVERNQESTKLQYALVDRAFHFGWARETIVTIDDDLGRSGSTIEGRLGFQRLVGEGGLGHVGLVLGIEMSRLARSCRDWHQLLEICALFDTLIADVDGVYDPANYNDRLLLGLKGTMSEAELHILQARMLAGLLSTYPDLVARVRELRRRGHNCFCQGFSIRCFSRRFSRRWARRDPSPRRAALCRIVS